jgi:uncharacterized membrane protein YkvA (DUF1232 family)
VSRDDRVPRRAKAVAGAAAAYVVSPIDPVPDAIPVVGWLDDLLVASAALRYLLKHAGYGVITDLWRGTDDGLALVLFLGGVER